MSRVCDCNEILGLADMSSKNEAQDFAAKAVRKTQSKMKLSVKLSAAAGHDRDFNKEMKKNKEAWEKVIDEDDK